MQKTLGAILLSCAAAVGAPGCSTSYADANVQSQERLGYMTREWMKQAQRLDSIGELYKRGRFAEAEELVRSYQCEQARQGKYLILEIMKSDIDQDRQIILNGEISRVMNDSMKSCR